jgi:hypothetical protein
MNSLSELKNERKHILDDYSQALMIFKEINKIKVESQEQAGETAEKQMNLSNYSDQLDSFQASFLGLNLSSEEAFQKLKEMNESIKTDFKELNELRELKKDEIETSQDDTEFFLAVLIFLFFCIVLVYLILSLF